MVAVASDANLYLSFDDFDVEDLVGCEVEECGSFVNFEQQQTDIRNDDHG